MSNQLECFPGNGPVEPIFESETCETISPTELDVRLANGWRHFGTDFFRTNIASHGAVFCGVLSLRVNLATFAPSRSQRRLLRRNADLTHRVVPARHDAIYDEMFDAHKTRFTENIPDSLRDFLSENPGEVPCETLALEVCLADSLIAVSFLDAGETSSSSVYAMFDPAESARGLGNHTLLLEVDEAKRRGHRYLYLGYAYTVPSPYDYKKRFGSVEVLDWKSGNWIPLPPGYEWSLPRPGA